MGSLQQVNCKAVLADLKYALQVALDTLKREPVKSELHDALHNDDSLPDKAMASLAAETIDLLAETQQLLEPGHLVLADHFLGYTNTKCLVAAVALRIPDALRPGPQTLDALATTISARPDRLEQILRPLYNNGIFAYDATTHMYRNNHVSTLLLSDHWTQWHNWVDLYGNEFYDIARGIPASVRAGAVHSAAQINFDTDADMFEYFHSRGWVPRLHATLGGGAAAMAPGILADYPWAEVGDKTVMDIGGGGGALVASLLRRHGSMRGGIYDLPSVISHVSDFFLPGGQYEDLAARVPQGNLVAGDFMKWVPRSEVYVMKWVLHDWVDEQAVTILRNIRKAIVPGPVSRLIVLESILCDGQTGRLSRYGDINMMMTAKGGERTEVQWRKLVDEAGWRVAGIYPLRNAWVQAIDLRP